MSKIDQEAKEAFNDFIARTVQEAWDDYSFDVLFLKRHYPSDVVSQLTQCTPIQYVAERLIKRAIELMAETEGLSCAQNYVDSVKEGLRAKMRDLEENNKKGNEYDE